MSILDANALAGALQVSGTMEQQIRLLYENVKVLAAEVEGMKTRIEGYTATQTVAYANKDAIEQLKLRVQDCVDKINQIVDYLNCQKGACDGKTA